MKKFTRKQMKLTSGFLLIGLLILFTGFISYQKQNNTEYLKEKIREYLKKNVAPVMKTYRHDFDKKLSKNEIMKIENVRNELKSIIETRKKAGFEGGNKISTELTAKEITLLKETRQKAYRALLKIMVIADNHENELTAIFEKEKQNQQKWTRDITEIMSENSGKKFRIINPVIKHNIERLMPFENFANILFVIWDPEKPILEIH